MSDQIKCTCGTLYGEPQGSWMVYPAHCPSCDVETADAFKRKVLTGIAEKPGRKSKAG